MTWNVVVAVGLAALAIPDPAAVTAPADVDWVRLRKEVTELRRKAGSFGFGALVSGGVATPLIRSQSWVDWIPKEDVRRRLYEQEKRDFGMDLLKQLERHAVQIADMREKAALKREVSDLLALRRWLASAHGYGNYFVSRWAENIAMNAAARLAIDGEVPTDEVRSLLSAAPDRDSLFMFRVDVLNDEAPHVFTASPIGRLSGDDCLALQWARHLKDANGYFRRLFGERKTGGLSYRFEDVRNEDRKFAFYWDDATGDAALTEWWGGKCHYCLCVGDFDRNCRLDVEAIIRYREEMGSLRLPTENECAVETAREGYVDQIDYAWTMKHLYGKDFHVGDIVVRVCSGVALDFETRKVWRRRKVSGGGAKREGR